MGGMPGMDMGAFGGEEEDEDDKPTEHLHGEHCNHDTNATETKST